jgi:hypothetical protein
MMLHGSNPTSDLELCLEQLTMRYEYDAAGRIVGSGSDGICPRFVLVRAAEGCSWRLANGLPESLVIAVARLAGREPGLGGVGGGAGGPRRPRGQGSPAAAAPGGAPPPERLVMIERLFERAGLGVRSRRELVRHEDRLIGELWICD